MGFFETLVVGLDGSAASRLAVNWAAERVPAGGGLHLVYATGTEPRPAGIGECAGPAERMFSRERERADRICRAETSLHVVDGKPVDALLTMTELLGGDAVVVGPHSAPYNIGSLGRVTRGLVQQSPVPIIVAREAPATESTPGDVLPVVACIGYGESAERAAAWAADYAEHRKGQLTLLHVVGHRPMFPADSPSEMLASYLGGDVLRQWAREDLEAIGEHVRDRHGDLPVKTIVKAGSALRVISEVSAEAELIVLGKRETALLQSFISPRVHQLIARASGPVALVPSCATET